MATSPTPHDYLEAARSEDLKPQEVRDLGVVTSFERDIISSLKGPGAHLLQGARGVGKTTLLRLAETDMDNDFNQKKELAVYVNFKTSTLLEGISAGQKNAFQIWGQYQNSSEFA
jgi:predicted AAA+ superfamily ATPase